MAPVLIMPGIGGSGPLHWQTRWQELEPSYRRVQVPDWDRPELDAWVDSLDAAVRACGAAPVIAAHSLGCLAVAHWVARGGRAQSALLVALPDPEGREFPAVASSFAAVPRERLPLVTRVVASRNDPYGSFEFAERCAVAWGSSFSDAGAVGHINADSNLGDWLTGKRLLAELLG